MSCDLDSKCDRCHCEITGTSSIIQLYIPFPLGIRVENHTTWSLCPKCAELVMDILQNKIQPCDGKHASKEIFPDY